MGDVVAQPALIHVRLLRMVFQGLIIAGLEKVYEASRGLIQGRAGEALQNGLAVVKVERRLHILDEWKLQKVVFSHAQWQIGPLILDRTALISVINHFYLYSHFVGTLAFLAWLYLFRPQYFPFVRTVLFMTSGLALAIYIAFPMMPPRLMGSHLQLPHGYRITDTLAPILNYKLQQAQIGYNPYAAMPSLHFAWALILGATLVLVGRHIVLRVLGALYPVMMLATILVSGNHLLLDAAGSVVVVTIATAAAFVVERHLPVARALGSAGRTSLAA